MQRLIALLYGVSAYLFSFAAFLYLIGFLGNLYVHKTVDSVPSGPLAFSIVIDVLLLAAFALQHSVMARQGFKRRWAQLVPPAVERSTYIVATSLALILIFWQWRPIPRVLWDVRGSGPGAVLNVLFWAGWATVLTSTFLTGHLTMFGVRQVWDNFCGQKLDPSPFRTPGLYRVVRHPLYLGFVVAFWAAPVMTAGHLLISVGFTSYVLMGIYFEERDLVAHYGQLYRNYSARVPMLVPFLKRQAEPMEQTNRERRAAGGC